jgi:maltodextrin utilization protein YvdJ
MSELPKGVGLAGIALLPIVCCIGLPLLIAAGLSVAAFALIGGITVAAIALAAALVLLVVRARRRRACATRMIGNLPRRT